MTNVSLYHAAADVQNRIALCVDEDGVFDTEKFDMIEATFKDRAVAVVAVYKGKGHTVSRTLFGKEVVQETVTTTFVHYIVDNRLFFFDIVK